MKARNSKIELLRIVAMLLIVILHLIQNDGRFQYVLTEHSFNNTCIVGLKLFANIGVSIFALITGYFGMKFSYHKLFALMFKTWFYSLCITTVFFFCGGSSLKEIVQVMIPLNSGHWYINAYIILMMICMFAGEKINSISKEQFQTWLLIGCPLCYVFFWLSFDIGTNVVLVMYLYCLARYIARFQPIKMGGVNRISCISTIVFLLAFGVLIFTRSQTFLKLLGSNYSPVVLLLSVSLFLLIVLQKSADIPVVNKFAHRSLAVYLISEIHPVREMLMALQHTFDFKSMYVVFFAFVIYLSCCIIDWLLSPIETFLCNKVYYVLSIIRKRII